jgi:diaminopropionate ammonia-lyase
MQYCLRPDPLEVDLLHLNSHPDYGKSLADADAEMLGRLAPSEVERFLSHWPHHRPTPLLGLPSLACQIGVRSIHMKDESHRLGLGSFKALGGGYAVVRLLLEEAERSIGRKINVGELHEPDVRAVAAGMTIGCATDGNHGRSVAEAARLVGAKARIFVHDGVSARRIDTIAQLGAEVIRVKGTYDDAVAEATRICAENEWLLVSDTSWPGYERIPRLVMQGYTALAHEALEAMADPPTHVFIQAGVGGVAAAVAGHMAIVLGANRPAFVVVEPSRAACLLESIRAGQPVKIDHGEATVMAMLECYAPSLVAWRILARAADAFMTIDDEDAVMVMNLLARPTGGDPAIVAGESGGVGLAGMLRVAGDVNQRAALRLDAHSRVFVVNTEGATDPGCYEKLVGLAPSVVLSNMPANCKASGR